MQGRSSLSEVLERISCSAKKKLDEQFHLVIGTLPGPPSKHRRPSARQRRPLNGGKLRREGKAVEKEESTKLNEHFTGIARRVLENRARLAKNANLPGLAAKLEKLAGAYENPRKNPDLPFLWRATEWAAQGGTIALVLPARLYLLGPKAEIPANTGDDDEETTVDGTGHTAWHAVMQSVAITGIINGSDLRKTGVWRGVDVPFSIFFAKNELPTPRHAFRFVSPLYETRQNERGRFRVDYQNDVLVTCREVQKKPWLLKALALGNSLDVSLIERLLDAFPQTLGQLWKDWDNRGNRTGKGFDLSPELEPKPAAFLGELLDFERPPGFAIDYKRLHKFKDKYGRESAYWPKTESLYQPPLVIIPQSPGEEDNNARAFISNREIAFSQSYYGYSCKGHPEATTLAVTDLPAATRPAFLLFHSHGQSSVWSGSMHLQQRGHRFDPLP